MAISDATALFRAGRVLLSVVPLVVPPPGRSRWIDVDPGGPRRPL